MVSAAACMRRKTFTADNGNPPAVRASRRLKLTKILRGGSEASNGFRAVLLALASYGSHKRPSASCETLAKSILLAERRARHREVASQSAGVACCGKSLRWS